MYIKVNKKLDIKKITSYLIVKLIQNYVSNTNFNNQKLFVKLNIIFSLLFNNISLINEKKV